MCAYMQNICSETCAKCVRKVTYLVFSLQMLRISRYLLVHCVKGAELASFAVHIGVPWIHS